SVRRFPEGSTMEIRPVLGVGVPVSETSRLPLFEKVIPSGPSRPKAICVTGHCARASDCASNAAAPLRMATAKPRWRMVLFSRFEFILFSFLAGFVVVSCHSYSTEEGTLISGDRI